MFGLEGANLVVAIQVGYCISDVIAKCGVGILIYSITVAKSARLKRNGQSFSTCVPFCASYLSVCSLCVFIWASLCSHPVSHSLFLEQISPLKYHNIRISYIVYCMYRRI